MMGDQTVSTTANSISFASSSNDKYGGILEKSASKILRKEITELISYVYSVSPPFLTLHIVIAVIRILQLVGPALNPGFKSFWETDYVSDKFIFIYSIFFYFIPPVTYASISLPIMIAYIVITAISILTLVISAKIYKKNAFLPSFLPPIICFYFFSLGFVLPPMAVEVMFSRFSQYFFDASESDSMVRACIILVISVIITVIYLFIFLSIALQVLTFQPMSLMTICTSPQSLIILSTLGINLFMGLSEHSSKTVTIAFNAIVAVIYLVSSLLVFFQGGLVKHREAMVFLASCYTGFVTTIIIIVFQILNKKATFIIIGINLALEVVFVLLSDFILKRHTVRQLRLLDRIVDEPECFETNVKSVNSYINLVCTGFSELHPICLNWSFLKMGIERWPKKGEVWFVYAKFCSIYSEETQTLAWIFRSIVTNKVKGQASRTVKSQSLAIGRQREANLSPDLKAKLNNITKHTTQAKHRLRNVWDMAIQGNISDMEIATKRAIKSIQSSDGSLLHVLRLFPNNRFVTRQYARFCKELLADQKTCSEMIEKSRMLQRNINVNKDQTHEYGIMAYPMLPEKLSRGDMTISPTVNQEMSSSTIDLDDGDNETHDDESSVFMNRIENLRIPSTCGMSVITLLLYFILFAAPVIILLILIPMYIDGLVAPMEHMSSLSMARTLMYQIIAFGLQVLSEKFGLFALPNGTDPNPPVNFGSSHLTYVQLTYLCKELTIYMEKIDQFRTYNKANSNMKRAKELIFEPTINYSFFSKTVENPKMISLTSALADIVSQQRELITNKTLPDDFVNTSAILNPSTSMTTIAENFNLALSLMIKYISDHDNEQQNLIMYVMIAGICASAILFIVAAVGGVKWVQSNKEEAYRCFTSIPKNEVSQLAENLRILKKETENSTTTVNNNTESNKQEDNILKMFMTGGTNGARSHDSFYIAGIIILVMALQIVSLIIIGLTMKDISRNLRRNSPHLDYLQGMYANMMAATTCITSMIGFSLNYTNIYNANKENLLERVNARLTKSRDYYNLARFGGPTIDEPPFNAFQEFIDAANKKFVCPDEYQITTSFKNSTLCYTPSDLIILIEAIYRSYTIPYREDTYGNFEYLQNNPNLRIVWDLLIFPVYDIFIHPMSESIIVQITSDLNDMKDDKMIYIIILLVIGFVLEVALLFILHSIDNHIRGVLKLLLHAQPKVLATTPKIVQVLDGSFKKNNTDNGTRSTKFYEAILDDLPDAIVVSNEKNVITKFNRSASRILGNKIVDDILNKQMVDFLSTTYFGGNIGNLMNAQPQKPITETVTHLQEETGTLVNIEATSMIINEGLIVVFRDITQTIRYNTLIQEEKQKSDKLLGSILPASLVPRVQAGEKNISFAVQSATIVFMDIVSFTPWCGSLPAEKVMSTLNLLFMKNDNLVAKYPTMTKIKCIGDCYMAAGGVFAEVNQPAVHAKEVVNFGLDALDAISDLNKELNESLRIRVGINTGGPIVAGVLGIGKPTFEILGPAINMAQQMEHHGVPSQVHVSRSVYELIYGDAFTIKERGQIEVKNGMVVTYLVERKKK